MVLAATARADGGADPVFQFFQEEATATTVLRHPAPHGRLPAGRGRDHRRGDQGLGRGERLGPAALPRRHGRDRGTLVFGRRPRGGLHPRHAARRGHRAAGAGRRAQRLQPDRRRRAVGPHARPNPGHRAHRDRARPKRRAVRAERRPRRRHQHHHPRADEGFAASAMGLGGTLGRASRPGGGRGLEKGFVGRAPERRGPRAGRLSQGRRLGHGGNDWIHQQNANFRSWIAAGPRHEARAPFRRRGAKATARISSTTPRGTGPQRLPNRPSDSRLRRRLSQALEARVSRTEDDTVTSPDQNGVFSDTHYWQYDSEAFHSVPWMDGRLRTTYGMQWIYAAAHSNEIFGPGAGVETNRTVRGYFHQEIKVCDLAEHRRGTLAGDREHRRLRAGFSGRDDVDPAPGSVFPRVLLAREHDARTAVPLRERDLPGRRRLHRLRRREPGP